jgi:uncharacterized protein with HEPN domain
MRFDELREKRESILAIAARYHAGNVRVNLDTIWDVIEGFLSPLRDCVSAILAQRDGTDVSP